MDTEKEYGWKHDPFNPALLAGTIRLYVC